MLSRYLHSKGTRLGLPISGTFELTPRCNFNCKMCYVHLSEEEQRIVSGGGEFKDAVNEFLDHLHLQDLILGRGLISFSISFVPMMLFTVVKTGFNVAVKIYDFLLSSPVLAPSISTSETIQDLVDNNTSDQH